MRYSSEGSLGEAVDWEEKMVNEIFNNKNEEKLIAKITELVLRELQKGENAGKTGAVKSSEELSRDDRPEQDSDCRIVREKGPAAKGSYPDEVVVGLGPAFGTVQIRTINDLSHEVLLRELAAGIEEEGLRARFIKVYDTSDVSFIALKAAKYSGSGIGVGIQSKGTAVIHQKDLFPLTNLELFPQAPLITAELYRKIGKNAAKYAKGQSPVPIESENDCMIRPKYQTKAAILHIKETGLIKEGSVPVELEVMLP